ncbi:MAG TPA: hypothetical protein VK489_12350 [Ferruginibacter sp.]|nr:hypothetical protein [Ferruginibacter sp.]
MKKIFTLILVAAGLSITAASAQNRNDRYNDQDRYQVDQPNDNWKNSERNQSRNYGNNDRRERNVDHRRQAEYDRMNRDYDRRIDGYRNDRRMNRYERDRRIQEAEYERQEKRKAFGNGVVVGGIAAIVLGVLIGGGR